MGMACVWRSFAFAFSFKSEAFSFASHGENLGDPMAKLNGMDALHVPNDALQVCNYSLPVLIRVSIMDLFPSFFNASSPRTCCHHPGTGAQHDTKQVMSMKDPLDFVP